MNDNGLILPSKEIVVPDTQLGAFVSGEEVNTFGLHLIATPDTQALVNKVRDNIQALLDLAGKNKYGKSYRRDVVTSSEVGNSKFASGECEITLEDSVRGKHVYVFSDPNGDHNSEEMNLNDKLMNDLLLLEAVRDHGAQTTNIVQGCIPYARQDKTTPDKRQPVSIDFVGGNIARLTGKTGYCITINLHNPTSKGAFKGTNFINLYTGWFINQCIDDMGLERGEEVLSPADQGGIKVNEAIAKEQSLSSIVVIKGRDYSQKNSVERIDIYGDIEGKDVIIQDDMLDTGGTMVKLLEEMLEKNPRSINLAITHGMFNGEAYVKLKEVIDKSNGVIKNVYVTDSINKEGLPDYVKTISLEHIITNTITSIYKGMSINRGDAIDYTNLRAA